MEQNPSSFSRALHGLHTSNQWEKEGVIMWLLGGPRSCWQLAKAIPAIPTWWQSHKIITSERGITFQHPQGIIIASSSNLSRLSCGSWLPLWTMEEVLRHNIMRHCYSSGGFWSPFQIMCLIETCLCYIIWLMFWPSMQDVILSHCLKVRLWKAIWRGTAKEFLKNYIFLKTWSSCFKGPPTFSVYVCAYIHGLLL